MSISPVAKPKRSGPEIAFARSLNTVSVSGSFTLILAIPSSPTGTRGRYTGTGVKFFRTEMFSMPQSSTASSPPGFSSSGMMPNAMLRVSRAAIRVGRFTTKDGSGSSGRSRANDRTA